MKKYLLILLSIVVVACKQAEELPKVAYDKEKSEVQKPKETLLKVADLPVQIDGSPYLLHPMGEVRVMESRETSFESSSTSSVSYRVSNYDPFELTGEIENIAFQHVDSLEMRRLTDKTLKIQSVTYLPKAKKPMLLYVLADSDTNKDGFIDANDIKNLYISTPKGTLFTKLTQDYQELIDWEFLEGISRLYFRSIEDSNKNGTFDNKDTLHYYYINLVDERLEVQEYSVFKKL